MDQNEEVAALKAEVERTKGWAVAESVKAAERVEDLTAELRNAAVRQVGLQGMNDLLKEQLAAAEAKVERYAEAARIYSDISDVRAHWANGEVCEHCSHALCVRVREAEAKLKSAHAFSDENISRLTRLHGEALTRVEELEEILDATKEQLANALAKIDWLRREITGHVEDAHEAQVQTRRGGA